MEGALLGVSAIAVSLAARPPHDFAPPAAFAAGLARSIAALHLPKPILLNVNVPAGPVKGFRFTRLGVRTYGNEVIEKQDPRGRSYFWIGGDASHQDIPLSDCNTVLDEGLVAVTPLNLDLTHDGLFAGLADLAVTGFRREPAP
jgi:5'-nucleotidase